MGRSPTYDPIIPRGLKARPIIATMAEDSTNSTEPTREGEKETLSHPLTIWDNTPEEESLELAAFKDAIQIEIWDSLPPYDWL